MAHPLLRSALKKFFFFLFLQMLAKSPRPTPNKAPTPPQVSPRPSLVPAEALNEVARLTRSIKGKGDVVTDDALLAGWLHVKRPKMGDWAPRFFQLRSGSLTSYGCSAQRMIGISDKTTTKTSPVPESASRWLRADVTVLLQISDPSIYKLAAPSLFVTAAQAKMLKEVLEGPQRGNPIRVLICFRPDIAGAAPIPVVVRIGIASLYMFDLEDVLEYTLMGLSLQATDEPVCQDYPFGLMITSAVSDQMFVPLDNVLVAAQTPLVILQWMGALQNADLDPPAPQPTPTRQVLNTGKNAVTRGERSGSGALIGQLVSNAVGNTGSFSGLSELVQEKSNDTQKKELDELLRAIKWDPANPRPLREAIYQEEFQRALAEFCRTIFTEENVNFCIAVIAFRSTRDARAKQAQCRQIVAEFISYSGKSVVNINSVTRKRCEDILSSGVPLPAHVFDAALDEVLALIESDSWPKFVARLNEMYEDTALEHDDHSWESGDSSSYEERETQIKQRRAVGGGGGKGRANSLGAGPTNDFGDATEVASAQDVEKIRAEIARNDMFDPKDLPTLKVLLAKRDARRILQQFARTILAEENVMFWEHVQRFKATDSLDERKKHLKMLFDEFIPAGSKTMVNIAGTERARLMKLYGEQGIELAVTKDVFDAALVECIKVMELDLYPKFINLVKEVRPASGGNKDTLRTKVLPLWEMLNDPDELNLLLLFAAANNQQDDILFWCLVGRFRMETDGETRGKLGTYIMSSYVSANAPRMVRVDKSKKAACVERFSELSSKKANLPADLFDALWRDVQSSMNKHLHPAYEKFVRKPKKSSQPQMRGDPTTMLEHEFSEALKEDEVEKHAATKWVPVKSLAPVPASEGPDGKKSLLGGGRRKVSPK